MIVVLDPGHGGRDPGAISPHTGAREADLTLALAHAVTVSLGDGVRVHYTRVNMGADEKIGPRRRVEKAAALGASLLVSIHLNADDDLDEGDAEPNGYQIHCYRKGVVGTTQSYRVAEAIIEQLGALPLRSRGIKPCVDSVGRLLEPRAITLCKAAFERRLPAVLVECAFLTSRTDSEWIGKAQNVREVGHWIAAGISDAISQRVV